MTKQRLFRHSSHSTRSASLLQAWLRASVLGVGTLTVALGSLPRGVEGVDWLQSTAQAQDGAGSSLRNNGRIEDRRHRWRLGGGIGLTASPTTFLLGVEGGYYVLQNLELVPRFAIGADDGALFFLSGQARYVIDIPRPKARGIKPYIGGGLGMAASASNGEGDAAFLLEIPLGFDYYIKNSGWSVGTQMTFDIPITLDDDNFIYQWQIATAHYLF